jgi:hypothetical protein
VSSTEELGPNIAWTDVLSSRVQRVGYDADASNLYVTWASGRTSRYRGVPADTADEFTRSWSVGSAVNSMLSSYPMDYV